MAEAPHSTRRCLSRSARDGYGTSRQLTPIPLSRADADPRNVLHEDDPSILVAGSSLISRSSSLWKGQAEIRRPAGRVAPESTLDRGRAACRAAIERVKELYDRALEQQLTNALTALSKQYEAEMEQQAGRVGELQEQLQRLEEAVKDLKPQLGRTEALAEDLKQQVKTLGSGLQGDRRSVEKGLNVIWQRQQRALERQRGPERDYGPSR